MASIAAMGSSRFSISDLGRDSADKATKVLFQIAEKVVSAFEERNVQTVHDIIPCTELYDMPVSLLEGMYGKYGEKFLQYCELMYKIKLVRRGYMAVVDDPSYSISHPNTILALAVVDSKVGACSEFSMLGVLLASQHGLMASQMTFISDKRDSHGFVLISPTIKGREIADRELRAAQEKNTDIYAILSKLKGHIVFDPYLKALVFAEHAEKDPVFSAGIAAMGTRRLYSMACAPLGPELARSLLRDVEKVKAIAIEKGLIKELVNDVSGDFANSKRFLQITGKLQEVFSDTRGLWKYQPVKRLIWGRFSEELAAKISAQIKTCEIVSSFNKVIGKADYVVQIPLPYMEARSIWERIQSL